MVSKQKKNISACDNPPTRKHVIDCYDTAKVCYSAKALFVDDYITKKEALDEPQAYDTDFRKEERKKYRHLANIAWEQQGSFSKANWQSMSRLKLTAQP